MASKFNEVIIYFVSPTVDRVWRTEEIMKFTKWLEERHPEMTRTSGFVGSDREGSKWKSKQYLTSSKNSRARRLDTKKRKEADARRVEEE